MSQENQVQAGPSFGQRLGKGLLWLLRFGLRLFFVVLIGVALGAAVYYGMVALYNQYIAPVQAHTLRLEQIDIRQEQDGALVTRRLSDVQERLDTLELRGDADKQAIAALEADLVKAREVQQRQLDAVDASQALQADLDRMQADLEAALAAQEAVQSSLEAMQAALETGDESMRADLEAVQSAQERIGVALGRIQGEQETIRQALEEVQTQAEAWGESIESRRQEIAALAAELQGPRSPAALSRELALVRAMNLLSRARTLLAQSNYGLAQTDLLAARDLLVALQAGASDAQVSAITAIVARLDAALDNLPDAPVAAANEMDGAWELLAAGLPVAIAAPPTIEGPEAITVTVSVTETAMPEATPAMTVTVTPTLEATLAVTVTVTPSPGS